MYMINSSITIIITIIAAGATVATVIANIVINIVIINVIAIIVVIVCMVVSTIALVLFLEQARAFIMIPSQKLLLLIYKTGTVLQFTSAIIAVLMKLHLLLAM